MKVQFTIFLFLIIGQSVFAQSNKTLKAIKAFEQKRYVAIVQKDYKTLDELMTDDLIYTHSNAVVEDKNAYFEAFKSGKYNFISFSTDSTQYRMLKKKVVLAAGIVHIHMNYFKTEVNIKGRFTAVYVKRNRRWQLAAWQTTKKS
jgi:ketosteroid isomerase-like protein